MPSSTHILLLSTHSLTDPAGIGRHFPFAKQLAANGYSTTLLTLHPDFEHVERKDFLKDGVWVRYVSQMHVLKRDNRKEYFKGLQLLKVMLLATVRLFWAGLKQPADRIICLKPQPLNGLPAVLLSLIKRVPLMVDCDDYEAGSGKLSTAQRLIVRFFENNLPRLAQIVTYHSTSIGNYLRNLGLPESRIYFLPNGYDSGRFKETGKSLPGSVRPFFADTERSVILYFGSLSSHTGQHRVDLLISAFILLTDKYPDARLAIVGGGDDFERLKRLIPDRLSRKVLFTGAVPPEDIPLYIKHAAVTVEPIVKSDAAIAASPLKLIESMVCGVPCVTLDVGDRRKLLQDGKAGVLLKESRPEDWAAGISLLLSNEKLRNAISAKGVETAELYSWEVLTRQFLLTVTDSTF